MKIYVYVRQEEAILAGSEKYGVMETTVDVSKLSERQRKAFASLGSNTSLNLDTGIVSEETIVAALDRMATKTEKPQMGDSTHNHPQSIWPVSFKTLRNIPKRPQSIPAMVNLSIFLCLEIMQFFCFYFDSLSEHFIFGY